MVTSVKQYQAGEIRTIKNGNNYFKSSFDSFSTIISTSKMPKLSEAQDISQHLS